jgi:hypothetical protein
MVMVISTMIFQTLKFSKRRFQTDCDEINSQKEINVPKQLTSDNGPVSLLLYEKKIKTELKATQRLKAKQTKSHYFNPHYDPSPFDSLRL